MPEPIAFDLAGNLHQKLLKKFSVRFSEIDSSFGVKHSWELQVIDYGKHLNKFMFLQPRP